MPLSLVWLAREVKRARDAQRAAVTSARLGLHDDVRSVAIRALDRHLVGTAALGVVIRNRIAESVAEEIVSLVRVESQALPEFFPFVTCMHREVVLRPKDGVSQDVEMTPDEADRVAYVLRAAARGLWRRGIQVRHSIQLSGNAPLEIFLRATSLHRQVVLQHKDGESQDLVLSPDEAGRCADQLCAAAAAARVAEIAT